MAHRRSVLGCGCNRGDAPASGSRYPRGPTISSRSSSDAVEASVPIDLDVHHGLDNAGTHKTKLIRNWLAKSPPWRLHFTPTSASRINQVERRRRNPTPIYTPPASIAIIVPIMPVPVVPTMIVMVIIIVSTPAIVPPMTVMVMVAIVPIASLDQLRTWDDDRQAGTERRRRTRGDWSQRLGLAMGSRTIWQPQWLAKGRPAY